MRTLDVWIVGVAIALRGLWIFAIMHEFPSRSPIISMLRNFAVSTTSATTDLTLNWIAWALDTLAVPVAAMLCLRNRRTGILTIMNVFRSVPFYNASSVSAIAVIIALGIRRNSIAPLFVGFAIAAAVVQNVHYCVLLLPCGVLVRYQKNAAQKSVAILLLIAGFLFGIAAALIWFLGNESVVREIVTQNISKHILIEDLKPNIGLYWCFFTHIFDKYRVFFLIVFLSQLYLIQPSLYSHFHYYPDVYLYLSLEVLALYNPQTSIGDFMFSLYFLINCWDQIKIHFRIKILPIIFTILGITGSLSPVMLYLWLYQGTGNPNFFYFQMLVFNAARIVLLFEVATVARIIKYEEDKRK